jgi:hypothetical protein
MKIKFCGEKHNIANQFQTKNLSLLPFKEKKYSFELECSIEAIMRLDQVGTVGGLSWYFRINYKNFEPSI